MKYTTLATCAALSVVTITAASCTTSPESLIDRMLTLCQSITTIIEETTEDNVAEQNIKLQKAVVELNELKAKISKLPPEQMQALEQNQELKERTENIIEHMLQTLMEFIFKKPEVMKQLMQGVDLQGVSQ